MGVKIGKNRCKFEVQHKVPLGIDFSSILVGFGSQVGREHRAKIEQKSIQKGIKKIMKKWMRFGRFWVGWADGRVRGARNPGPPQSIKIKENHCTQKPKAKRQGQREHPYTPGAQARWQIFYISLDIFSYRGGPPGGPGGLGGRA